MAVFVLKNSHGAGNHGALNAVFHVMMRKMRLKPSSILGLGDLDGISVLRMAEDLITVGD